MAAIQQSWPARVLQSPTGALIASHPHSHGLRALGSCCARTLRKARSYEFNKGRIGGCPPPIPLQRDTVSLKCRGAEEFRPRRGQSGKREKSVKKNAALLHFLGFFPLTLLFGVPRGACPPLGRGPLPRNSGTFFVSFCGHKKGKPCGRSPLKRGGRRRVAAPGHLQPQSKIKQ